MAKTFYIETSGCQMNVHDSEKVVGTPLRLGYTPVVLPWVALVRAWLQPCRIKTVKEAFPLCRRPERSGSGAPDEFSGGIPLDPI